MPASKKHNIPEKGYKRLKKHRISQEGSFYFITTCSFNKQNLFGSREPVQIVFDTIDWLEQKEHLDCYFAIVMPDHIHVIFQLLGKKTLSEVMKSLKGFTGRKIRQQMSLNTPVWQDQYYDHMIREDEDLVEIIKNDYATDSARVIVGAVVAAVNSLSKSCWGRKRCPPACGQD